MIARMKRRQPGQLWICPVCDSELVSRGNLAAHLAHYHQLAPGEVRRGVAAVARRNRQAAVGQLVRIRRQLVEHAPTCDVRRRCGGSAVLFELALYAALAALVGLICWIW